MPHRAVAFDLLTALLDSWTLWNAVAGDETPGLPPITGLAQPLAAHATLRPLVTAVCDG